MPAPTQATLIDVVNGRDEEVGTAVRGEVLEAGRNFRTAHIFVVNGSGEILLQRLSPARARHPCRWGSSVAAYLFAGETYLEAAERRLEEELGVSAPLHQIGKIEMLDERSLKFVALFSAHAEHPTIRDSEHIDALEYWPQGRIDRALNIRPGDFTPTFERLYRAFRGALH